jgi:hypothetical protein
MPLSKIGSCSNCVIHRIGAVASELYDQVRKFLLE